MDIFNLSHRRQGKVFFPQLAYIGFPIFSLKTDTILINKSRRIFSLE